MEGPSDRYRSSLADSEPTTEDELEAVLENLQLEIERDVTESGLPARCQG